MPFLLRLRREHVAGHPADADAALDDAQHLERLRHRFECAQVLLLEGTAVGMVKLLQGADVWEILQFQVCRSMQGRGVGRAVLAQVITEANAARVQLAACVRKDNPAQRLYAALGFRIVGEDPHEFQMRRSCD